MPPGIPPVLSYVNSDAAIKEEAASIVSGLRTFSVQRRRHIAAYGRCLLLGTEPTQKQTQRFITALRLYRPYTLVADRFGSNLAALRQFQHEIARLVAAGA